MEKSDGRRARTLLREASRGEFPELGADGELLALGLRACAKAERPRDVLELYDTTSQVQGGDPELDAHALVACASTAAWPRAQQLLDALLKTASAPSWADDDTLRFAALATAAEGGDIEAATRLVEGVTLTSAEVSLVMAAGLKGNAPRAALGFYERIAVAELEASVHAQALDALLAVAAKKPAERGDADTAQALSVLGKLQEAGTEPAEMGPAIET